jgi:hypothetical protein
LRAIRIVALKRGAHGIKLWIQGLHGIIETRRRWVASFLVPKDVDPKDMKEVELELRFFTVFWWRYSTNSITHEETHMVNLVVAGLRY